jgi:hypothetical protein
MKIKQGILSKLVFVCAMRNRHDLFHVRAITSWVVTHRSVPQHEYRMYKTLSGHPTGREQAPDDLEAYVYVIDKCDGCKDV